MKYLGLILGLSLLLCSNTVVLANNAVSLDDIGNTTAQEVQSSTGTQVVEEQVAVAETNGTVQEAKGFMGSLQAATDMSAENETAKKIGGKMNKVVSVVVQVISYVITFGLTLRIALDLTYIAVPFLRGILGNGYAGAAQSGQQSGMGMGTGGIGGFGGGGFGGGFGGGGFGASRFGGMSTGFGSPGMGMGMGAQQQGQQGTGIQFVSNAALNAVASEGVPGPDGKPNNVFKIYTKDMIVVLVLTPILLVLAITGALTNLGLLLGEALAGFISGFSGFSL